MVLFGLPVDVLDIALWSVQLLLLMSFLIQGKCAPLEKVDDRKMNPMAYILYAWGFRLSCFFVMTSIGFAFFILDDPCRWGMAAGWAKTLGFMTWDGVWLGMTSYLHGLSMMGIGHPIAASKIMTIVLNFVALSGIYFFSFSLSKNRVYAALTMVFMAPYFLHIVLGTGTLTEVPVVGFSLLGFAFLIYGYDLGEKKRKLYFLLSSVFFLISTGFHYVAWIFLLSVMVLLFLSVFWNYIGERRISLAEFFLFSIPSTLYCIAWMVSCWKRFGNPLYSMTTQMKLSKVYVGDISLLDRMMAYPSSLLFAIGYLWIMVVFSIFWYLFVKGNENKKFRLAILSVFVTLAIFIVTSIVGGHNNTPYRSLICISTILLIVAPAPLFFSTSPRMGSSGNASHSCWRTGKAQYLLIGAFSLLIYAVNIQNLSEIMYIENVNSGAVAIGSWLREEVRYPRTLSQRNLLFPIVFVRDKESADPIFYLLGNRENLSVRKVDEFNASPRLKEAQVVVSREDLNVDGLSLITKVAEYMVYQYDEKR